MHTAPTDIENFSDLQMRAHLMTMKVMPATKSGIMSRSTAHSGSTCTHAAEREF